MKREQANIEIIRTCDGKVNTHNRIIIAEAFGIFSLLNLSKGKGDLFTKGLNAIFPIFLTITYFALIVLILYSFARSIHYSRMIQFALHDISRTSEDEGASKYETISEVFDSLYDKAQKSCPRLFAEIVKLRRKNENFSCHLAVVAAIFSGVLWFLVLFMP